jgi:hypothetical protein
MDLKKTGWESVDWIYLVLSKNKWWTIVTGNEGSDSIKCGKYLY